MTERVCGLKPSTWGHAQTQPFVYSSWDWTQGQAPFKHRSQNSHSNCHSSQLVFSSWEPPWASMRGEVGFNMARPHNKRVKSGGWWCSGTAEVGLRHVTFTFSFSLFTSRFTLLFIIGIYQVPRKLIKPKKFIFNGIFIEIAVHQSIIQICSKSDTTTTFCFVSVVQWFPTIFVTDQPGRLIRGISKQNVSIYWHSYFMLLWIYINCPYLQ